MFAAVVNDHVGTAVKVPDDAAVPAMSNVWAVSGDAQILIVHVLRLPALVEAHVFAPVKTAFPETDVTKLVPPDANPVPATPARV